MNQRLLLSCLAALVMCTNAAADTIPFFNVQFEATAIALSSDGPAGFASQSGAQGGDMATASADSLGSSDIATAGAIAGLGLLTTSADVSAGNLSSAVATAWFSGSFVNTGGVSLSLDFSGLNFASGSGAATTTLFVSLVNNGVTLFADYVQGPWQLSYAPALGSTSVLDLTLTSEVNAAFLATGAGDASSFGLVGITGAVPEASTWLLFTLGLGAVAAVRARSRRGSTALG